MDKPEPRVGQLRLFYPKNKHVWTYSDGTKVLMHATNPILQQFTRFGWQDVEVVYEP